MRRRDIEGLKNAKFGQHTKLVHKLAALIERQHEAILMRKSPVLIVVESDGEFNVFGCPKADVSVVHLPQGNWDGRRREMAERFVEASISDSHKRIYLPSRWIHKGDHRSCRTLEKLIEKTRDALVVDALKELENKNATTQNTNATKH